jgi:hypothetical protein
VWREFGIKKQHQPVIPRTVINSPGILDLCSCRCSVRVRSVWKMPVPSIPGETSLGMIQGQPFANLKVSTQPFM